MYSVRLLLQNKCFVKQTIISIFIKNNFRKFVSLYHNIKHKAMAYNVMEIANKILATPDTKYEELISNLKLQKLLYYMQGFHLAVFNEPLFEDKIEAWQYGPVVPCVYNKYKEHGTNGIFPEQEPIILTVDEENLFHKVYEVYGVYNAIGLMKLTHKEEPWTSTPVGKGHIISRDKMKAFFKTRLK